MRSDDSLGKHPTEEADTDPLDSRQRSILIFQRTLMSLRGHAPFAYLGEIHRLAVEEHGFAGSLEEAAELLADVPEVRIAVAPSLSESPVYAPAYWSPTG